MKDAIKPWFSAMVASNVRVNSPRLSWCGSGTNRSTPSSLVVSTFIYRPLQGSAVPCHCPPGQFAVPHLERQQRPQPRLFVTRSRRVVVEQRADGLLGERAAHEG